MSSESPVTDAGRKILRASKWIPAYLVQTLARRRTNPSRTHLVLAIANHFEPYILPYFPGLAASLELQLRRTKDWIRHYETAFDTSRDSDGAPLRHTYFFPGERYDADIVSLLSEHCARGWGEVEVHLHHGLSVPDTAEGLRRQLLSFRSQLVAHGCLSVLDGMGEPQYAFVHGNFALANSGRACGVDSELLILSQTGCYADFTLPAWPNPAQTSKINSLYECKPPLDRRAAHRSGRNLAVGHRPSVFPLIIQGPLTLNVSRRYGGVLPSIDNSAVTGVNPPSIQRLKSWLDARIRVEGKPDWIFIKLHCHGMDPRDTPTLLGEPMTSFLRQLRDLENKGSFRSHFVTAREMTNIILAACDGEDGSPSDFRDYRLRLIRSLHPATGASCHAQKWE